MQGGVNDPKLPPADAILAGDRSIGRPQLFAWILPSDPRHSRFPVEFRNKYISKKVMYCISGMMLVSPMRHSITQNKPLLQ